MRKKQTLANIITACALGLIILAAVLAVGLHQGWFVKPDIPAATVTDCTGMVSLERGGIASPVTGEMALRSGDKLELAADAHAAIRLETGWISLEEGSRLTVSSASAAEFAVTRFQGDLFAVTGGASLSVGFWEDSVLDCAGTVCSLKLDASGGNLAVFGGEAALTVQKTESVAAGQGAALTPDGFAVQALDITALDESSVQQLLALDEARMLCFTSEALNQLIADRERAAQAELEAELLAQLQPLGAPDAAIQTAQAMSAALSSAMETGPEDADPKPSDAKDQPQNSSEEAQSQDIQAPASASEGSSSKPAASSRDVESGKPGASESGSQTEAGSGSNSGSASGSGSPSEPEPEEPAPAAYTCTISIRCDTILNNMDQLDDSKTSYVPSSGTILSTTAVAFTEGESVYDVLKRACSSAGIQLEANYTPGYGSYYVEGIHQIYEFDCGPESGWMYKVNGSFPSKGCSSYILSQGDSIVWCYTCSGLGADVGA